MGNGELVVLFDYQSMTGMLPIFERIWLGVGGVTDCVTGLVSIIYAATDVGTHDISLLYLIYQEHISCACMTTALRLLRTPLSCVSIFLL